MKLFLLLSYFWIFSLQAEVEKITISWNPGLCKESCILGIERRFKQIPGIDTIEVNPIAGSATLTWQENVPFSYVAINNALRWIGLRSRGQLINLTVRGTISMRGTSFILISSGDNTSFRLLNQDPAPQNTRLAHPVFPPELHEKLLKAKKEKLMAKVDGHLFSPERQPAGPYQLVINQLSFEEQPKEQNP